MDEEPAVSPPAWRRASSGQCGSCPVDPSHGSLPPEHPHIAWCFTLCGMSGRRFVPQMSSATGKSVTSRVTFLPRNRALM